MDRGRVSQGHQLADGLRLPADLHSGSHWDSWVQKYRVEIQPRTTQADSRKLGVLGWTFVLHLTIEGSPSARFMPSPSLCRGEACKVLGDFRFFQGGAPSARNGLDESVRPPTLRFFPYTRHGHHSHWNQGLKSPGGNLKHLLRLGHHWFGKSIFWTVCRTWCCRMMFRKHLFSLQGMQYQLFSLCRACNINYFLFAGHAISIICVHMYIYI